MQHNEEYHKNCDEQCHKVMEREYQKNEVRENIAKLSISIVIKL